MILDEGFEDAFQYTVVGKGHSRLKSTNLLERLNQDVRRREKLIRIFPNIASANRLVGAVLIDIHEEWMRSSRKYIKFLNSLEIFDRDKKWLPTSYLKRFWCKHCICNFTQESGLDSLGMEEVYG